MYAMQGISEIAQGQFGAVSRQQLDELDVTRHELAGFVRRGFLERVQPDAFVVRGSPETWNRSMSAALLSAGAGSGASHRLSGRLWAVHESERLEVRVPAGRQPRLRGVLVHRAKEPFRLTARSGVRITTIGQTLLDLGSVVDQRALEESLDVALSRRLITLASLTKLAGASATTGALRLRGALADRQPGDGRVESMLEAKFVRLLRRLGLPIPAVQAEIRHRGRLIARVDFLYESAKLIVELDGLLAHNTAGKLVNDLRRQNALVALGYTVIRFTWSDIERRPDYVVDTIRQFLCAPLPL